MPTSHFTSQTSHLKWKNLQARSWLQTLSFGINRVSCAQIGYWASSLHGKWHIMYSTTLFPLTPAQLHTCFTCRSDISAVMPTVAEGYGIISTTWGSLMCPEMSHLWFCFLHPPQKQPLQMESNPRCCDQ